MKWFVHFACYYYFVVFFWTHLHPYVSCFLLMTDRHKNDLQFSVSNHGMEVITNGVFVGGGGGGGGCIVFCLCRITSYEVYTQ